MTAGVDALPRSLWWLVAAQALLLSGSAMLISVNGLSGLLLAPDPAWATLPITSFVLGGALSSLPMSMLMQRHGRARGFALGCLAAFVGAMLTAAALLLGSFTLLCVGTFVFGIYNAAGQYLRFAAADLVAPTRRARALSLVLAGGLLGGFLGPALSRSTVDWWEPRFLATYLCLILLSVGVYLLTRRVHFPPPVAVPGGTRGASLRALARRPGFWLAVAASASAWAVMNMLMAASPLAMQACAYPFADAAWALQWHMLGMYAPMLVMGSILERIGARAAIGLGILITALSIGVAHHGTSVAHFVAALSLLGLGWALLFGGGNALLTQQHHESEKGLAQGIHDALMFAAMAVSSLLAARGATLAGWIDLQWLGWIGMAAMALTLLILGPRVRPLAA